MAWLGSIFPKAEAAKRIELAWPPRVPHRPHSIPHSARGYICPVCDLVLNDGVQYDTCPSCALPVDWIDLRRPVFACASCDHVSQEAQRLQCSACRRGMALAGVPGRKVRLQDEPAGRGPRDAFFSRTGLAIAHSVGLAAMVIGAIDSRVGSLMIVAFPVVFVLSAFISLRVLGSFVFGFRELLALVRDRRTRVVHGLEHATLKLLEAEGVSIDSGQTESASEFIVRVSPRALSRWRRPVPTVQRCVREAARRISSGEHELVLDDRCGTNVALGLLMSAVLCGVVMSWAALGSISPVAGAAYWTFGTALVAPGSLWLGRLAQRYLTTSTDCEHIEVLRVRRIDNAGARPVFRVQVDVGPAT